MMADDERYDRRKQKRNDSGKSKQTTAENRNATTTGNRNKRQRETEINDEGKPKYDDT